MNLIEIILTPRNITQGMNVLRQMKGLKTVSVNGSDPNRKYPSAEFWKLYDAGAFK
jgi:hypothetical protein